MTRTCVPLVVLINLEVHEEKVLTYVFVVLSTLVVDVQERRQRNDGGKVGLIEVVEDCQPKHHFPKA